MRGVPGGDGKRLRANAFGLPHIRTLGDSVKSGMFSYIWNCGKINNKSNGGSTGGICHKNAKRKCGYGHGRPVRNALSGLL